MRKLLTALLISVLLLLYSASYSQASTGYVITQGNDTIKCEFKHTFTGVTKYKPLNSGKDFIKVSTGMLKEYRWIKGAKDSSIYASVDIYNNNNKQFLERLEHGEIDLYGMSVTSPGYTSYGAGGGMSYHGGSTSNGWYVKKGDGQVKELKSNGIFNDGSRKKRKEMLLNMIADDKELADKFKNDNDFTLNNLRSYIHSYNLFKSINSVVAISGK